VAFSNLKPNIESARKNPLISEPKKSSPADLISTGIAEIDRLIDGFPRGAITEVIGSSSSGRTSLFLSTLANATGNQETCALVDVNDTLDVSAAAEVGIDFDRLLWVRCASSLDHGLKATDLLLQSGGFGLVILDLGDVSIKDTQQIQSASWYRFLRAIENTSTALVVVGQTSNAKWCASLILDLKKEEPAWAATTETALNNSASEFNKLLSALRIHVERRKPASSGDRETRFEAIAE
jgi:RecA/RadA recombinase